MTSGDGHRDDGISYTFYPGSGSWKITPSQGPSRRGLLAGAAGISAISTVAGLLVGMAVDHLSPPLGTSAAVSAPGRDAISAPKWCERTWPR